MYIYVYHGSDRIYIPKNINIDLLRFYGYCILLFSLIRRIMDIRIFGLK